MTRRGSSRRGNGEGSIFWEHGRDRWVGQLDLGVIDGQRVRRKVTGRTRSEVATRLREIREQHMVTRGSTTVRTVGDLLDRWLATSAASRLGESSSTFLNYQAQVDQHLKPVVGDVRLDRLSAELIDDYLLMKARDGYSRATLVRHRSILGQAFRWGVKRRHLSWDPASLAEMPPREVFETTKPKRKREPRALNAEEARAFVAAAAHRRNGTPLVLALTVGLRPGELLALTWDDIDLDAGLVHVRRAWKGSGQHRYLGHPKTEGSIRTLGIPSELVDLLRWHRKAQLEHRLRSKLWTEPDLEFVMGAKNGGPVDPANLRRLVSEVAGVPARNGNDQRGAGLGRLSPYDLRHSATSILSAAGVRNEELADLLGHVDTRMVERHYRHPLGCSVNVAVAPMQALLDRG